MGGRGEVSRGETQVFCRYPAKYVMKEKTEKTKTRFRTGSSVEVAKSVDVVQHVDAVISITNAMNVVLQGLPATKPIAGLLTVCVVMITGAQAPSTCPESSHATFSDRLFLSCGQCQRAFASIASEATWKRDGCSERIGI